MRWSTLHMLFLWAWTYTIGLDATGRLTEDLTTDESNIKEICQWETFNATCGAQEVVFVQSAHYGRMRRGRCIESDLRIGCDADILLPVDGRCSGRHHCTIEIPDSSLHQEVACLKDFLAYMEAEYTCVKVATSMDDSCPISLPAESDNLSGYIANIVTESSGKGSTSCPWRITASRGQHINITLYDFTVGSRRGGIGDGGSDQWRDGSRHCQVYAIIKETLHSRETAVCGDSQRHRNIYTSTSESVEISITGMSTPEQQTYFLLKYEVVGCADPRPPLNAWYSREKEKAVVRCNFTGQTWHLVCKGTSWVGDLSNCTGSPEGQGQGGRGILPPYGLLAAVIIGIILGIVLGLCLLGLVLGCRRRRDRNLQTRRNLRSKPGQRSDFYDPYDPANFKEQVHAGRSGDHGYTHVWELRTKKTVLELDETTQKLSAYHDRAAPVRSTYPTLQGTRKDHIYESPKFERRTLTRGVRGVPRPRGEYPFYPDFDPESENMRNMTLRTNRIDDHDLTSDETEEEPECEVHFTKGIGYRPVPRQVRRDDRCRHDH